MYCPDCGRKSQSRERYCPECGYPISALSTCLEKEKEASLGWAEKLIGKPKIEIVPPKEPPLASFATGREEPVKAPAKTGRICARCGADVELTSVCPECNDKLPSVFENDPFMGLVLRGIFQMIVRPAEFALNFPYPATGGTIQPLFYPAIASAFLVLTLPLGRPDAWIKIQDFSDVYIPIVTAFLGSIIITPLLLHISSWAVNVVAGVLDSPVTLRRTIRVAGAYVFWLMLIGIVYNLMIFGLYEARAHFREPFLTYTDYDLNALFASVTKAYQFLFAAYLAAFGLQYGRAFGGLYRLSWWKTVFLAVSTYGVLMPVWLYLMVLLPLHSAGLL